MKRYKKIVIGGIQSKIFNLILVTVILLTFSYLRVNSIHNNMLTELVTESGQKQQQAISDTTSGIMDQVVLQTLGRSNRLEAQIADRMFQGALERVTFLGSCAADLLAHPEKYSPQDYAGPDPADDGKWKVKVIYADGVDQDESALTAKLGLLANLSETMVSLCPAFGAQTIYISLPEGAHLTASSIASSWYTNGRLRSYDPRVRGWYRQAVEAGGPIFSDGETDASTGEYCIECAVPVYGPDGSLQAVVGTDLFLTELRELFRANTIEGEYTLLVNRQGHAVLTPLSAAFPLNEEDRTGDLRDSKLTVLAQVVDNAMQGNPASIATGELLDGEYYITASTIETTGWVLVSAYSKELSGKPTLMMQDNLMQIQQESQQTYRDKTTQYRAMMSILLVLIMAVTLGAALLLGKRIVGPLNTITRRIAALRGDDLGFQMEDIYRTGDEVEELATAFASLTKKSELYLDEIVKATAEKERIGTELSLATDIQAAMLPHIFPAFPNRPDFDIYASTAPAKEVGGDFYDFFLVDDDHLCMVIADVSGKGVPAALFMMASKIILQSIAMLGNSPAEVLMKTNVALCNNNEAEMFVTAWLGILELSTGKLTAANAGHEYPVLKRESGEFELYKDKHGFVLGGMDGVRYRDYTVVLPKGAKLFLYTDGVPEATNAQQELFGTERMLLALNEHPEDPPDQILENVRHAVDGFVKEAEQFDDLTMLCLEYLGNTDEKGNGINEQ